MKTLNQNELKMLSAGRNKLAEFKEGFCYGLTLGFTIAGLAPLGAFAYAFGLGSAAASTACLL